MPNPENKKAIVVGAGISGLACAYRLKQSGCDVRVLESADHVGGVMQTVSDSGFLCEAGPNSFQNTPEIMGLIEELDLSRDSISADARLPRFIFHGGRLLPVPMGPVGLLTTRLLMTRSKIKVLCEPWARSNRDGHEETLAEFVIRRFGFEVLQNFVAPFVSGIYAGDPSRLSAQSVFPSFIEFESKYGSVLKGFIQSLRNAPRPTQPRGLYSFRHGMNTLPRGLAARIGGHRISLGAQLETIGLTSHEAKSAFTLGARTSEGMREFFAQALVLAAPAYRSAELVAPISQALARDLTAIDYPPLAGICVAYSRSDVPHPLKGFGFLAPRGEGIRLLGCIWSSALFPGRAPEGSVLFTIFVGGATDTDAEQLSEGELAETVQHDLRVTLGITVAPRVIAIQRYKRAIPQYTIGHEDRVQRMVEELNQIPGLFLVGNYLRGVSAGDCIKQANEVATLVLKYFRS